MTTATKTGDDSRQKRKEEGKLKKRQRIEESGGSRPRGPKSSKTIATGAASTNNPHVEQPSSSSSWPKENGAGKAESSGSPSSGEPNRKIRRPNPLASKHRFGRVMETVPCRNKPRFSTVSIAVPGSVLSNCQTKELRTLMVGQIARAAVIYHVDEIIVFDDKLGFRNDDRQSGWKRHRGNEKDTGRDEGDTRNKEEGDIEKVKKDEPEQERRPRSTPEEFMARLLQYCECPQYLRRHFFPMHPDLQFAGLLAPVDAPHHVRAEDHSPYRDGVVLQKQSNEGASLVNCGIRNRPVEIDRRLAPGIRCTVKIDPSLYGKPGHIKGTVVSPSAPREDNGTYWGYTTRLAASIKDVFDGCPFAGGYDLKIGTSERGDRTVEDKSFKLRSYEHSLIVFGGVAGIEESVDADETIKLPGSQSKKLFDVWLNACPFQGSRTIRTEEAILITLSQLSSPLAKSSRAHEIKQEEPTKIEFSDDSPSEESSSSDKSGDENSTSDEDSE